MALWTRVQGLLAGVALGRAASASAEGVFEVTRQNAWARRPFRTLSAREAAQAAVADLTAEQTFTSLPAYGDPKQSSTAPAHGVNLVDDAKRDGVGSHRFAVYARMAQQMPQITYSLEMFRRKLIDSDTLNQILARQGYPDGLRPALRHLRWVLPPVTDLIRFAVREVYNPAQRAFLDLDKEFPTDILPDAAAIGLTDSTTRDYWAAHWDLPSYGQLSQMLFRGELTPDEFRASLKALDYAPTWRAKLEAIARAIPTMTDMSRLAVREVYNPAQRRALDLDAEFPLEYAREVAKHGMSRSDAEDLWAGHWRLPSAGQGYQMLFRGEITEAQLASLLKALDYAPTWRKKLENIAYRVPGRVDLRRMFRYGVMTRAQVKAGYQKLGYTDADAETLTKFAEAEKAAAGVTDEDTHVAKARNQLWTTTHRSYLAGELTATLARNKLAQVGVPVAERDAIIALWDHERELVRKTLTPAQIKKAWVNVVRNQTTGQPWTRDDAIGALVTLGYSVNDANEYLDIPPTKTE